MRGAAGIFLVRSNKGCQTFWMVRVFVKQRRHKDGGVEEVLPRVFPRTLRSRSSRTRRIVSRTTPAKAAPRREAPKFLVFSSCAHYPALAADRCVPLSYPIRGSRLASVAIHPVLAWAAQVGPSYRE